MTVIAARATNDGIEIAADSQTTYGDMRVTRGANLADSKLWATADGLMAAYCGTSSLGAILRRWTREHSPDGSDEAAICEYVDQFHAWRIEHYAAAGDIDEVSFMLAYRGRLWVIDQYAASEVPHGGYMAHGSGLSVALGALFMGATVSDAVSAACLHAEMCGGPVVWGAMDASGGIRGTVERLSAGKVVAIKEAA